MATYWCELAWLPPGAVHAGVLVHTEGARITAVESDVREPPFAATWLAGLTLPGLANAHSHAFHRALRGRTHTGAGSFWTWREQMYDLAGRLDPDRYLALARATYAEMALAGVTCVGEFHYLHHQSGGAAYDRPNLMGEVLVRAASEVGLRIALLDTCYLTGGVGALPAGPQLRFRDGDADQWAERVEGLRAAYAGEAHVAVGAAIHSVRAVPHDQLETVARWANHHAAPLHAHLSEQLRENTECHAAYGVSPTRLLHDRGVLGPRTTVVHATHLDDGDVALLGGSGTTVCLCPTTERDLADGIGPAGDLQRAGSPLALGSDSHAVIDLFEEARAVEMDERLATQRRGHWSAGDLLRALTESGHAALGFADAGVLAPGAWADLVSVRLDSVRTAGGDPLLAADTAVFAATANDVHHVVASGRRIVVEGRHADLGDVGALLDPSIRAVWHDK